MADTKNDGNLSPELKARIDRMTREEMAERWRFAPCGAELFVGEAGQYFKVRFNELGGFSPAISKRIGWENSNG